MNAPTLHRPHLNPVLARELRERMRRGRPLTAITVFVLLLALVLWAVYSGERNTALDPFGGLLATQAAGVGRRVFEWVLVVMFALLLFMVPALTSGAISGERERQTLVPLQLTLLRPRQIVTGKLTASVAFLFLLVVASLPLVSFTYLLGGMTFAQVVGSVAAMLFVGVVVAAITVACSAIFRRTQTATVMAYVCVFVLTVGSIVGWVMAEAIASRGGGDSRPPTALLVFNPALLVADVVAAEPSLFSGGPWTSLSSVLEPPEQQFDMIAGGFGFEDAVVGFDQFGNPIFDGDQGDDGPERADGPWEMPFWMTSMLVLSALSVVAVAVAARRVRTPAESER